jgi:SAM-dependent MidA family methyltransferase
MSRALYGPAGFYRTAGGPSAHFRTSAQIPLFACALAGLVCHVDAALGHPSQLDVVDVGAGGGELLSALSAQLAGKLANRLRLTGVDVAQRPVGLPESIQWTNTIPPTTGVLIANEWLDNVPFDIAQHQDGVNHYVLIEPSTGEQVLGDTINTADSGWLSTWWPLVHNRNRAEIGRTRDSAWTAALEKLSAGVALTIDYSHVANTRPNSDTVLGYQRGRVCPVVFDGSCDITAHVAIDAVAKAGEEAGARTQWLITQREALQRLGVTRQRPRLETARTDPAAYLRALALTSQAAELTDPTGLGSFHWLLQSKNCTFSA